MEGRGRRDVIIILILLIIIALVIISWISGLWSCDINKKVLTNKEKLTIADYINSVSVLVQYSNKLSINFFTTLNKYKDLTSKEVDTSLNQLIEESKILEENSKEINPPQYFEIAQGYLNLVFDIRKKAYEEFKPALFNVLNDLDYEKSIKQMSESFINMYMSDKIYLYFQEELKNSGERLDISNLTIIDSKILENDSFLSENFVASMVADFKSVTNLQERRGVAVISQSINFNPKIVNERDNYLIIQKGSQINISINIENQGNVSEQEVPVKLTYKIQGIEKSEKFEQKIGLINPSEQITVTFLNLKAYPGKKCEIIIEAGPVENEILLTNNKVQYNFIMES